MNRYTVGICLLGGWLMLLAATPLRTAEPVVNLPLWVVQERALRSNGSGVLREDWAGRAVGTLAGALANAPGLIMQESFGGFEPPRLSLRGSGLQSAPSSRGVMLTLDGFSLGLADGSFNSALFDPRLADRIDLYRGIDGARTAPATMGGAIDLVTPRAVSGENAISHVEAGSFGALRTQIGGGAQSTGVALHGGASFARQDGYREHSGQERAAFLASACHEFAAKGTAVLSVYYARPGYDVPGPLTLATARSAPCSVSADVVRDLPRRESEVSQVSAHVASCASECTLSGGLSWLHTRDKFWQLQANGVSVSNSDDVSARVDLARSFSRENETHLLRLGARVVRGWRGVSRCLNDRGRAGTLFGDDGLYATTATLAAEDSITWRKHFEASIGYTVMHARRDIADRLPLIAGGVSTARRSGYAAHLVRAELRWKLSSGISVFAGVSQTAEPPTFDDLIVVAGTYPRLIRRSQTLALQRATTWELGSGGRRGPFSWDATAYRGSWTSEILRLADAGGVTRGTVNAGPTLHLGLETSFRWRLIDQKQRLSLNVTSAWNRFYFDNDPLFGRNRLAGVPPQLGTAELLYEHPSGWFGACGVDWVAGPVPVDHAGRMTYPGHGLGRVRFGWRRHASVSFFVDIRNIFDRAYIASTAGVLDMVRNPAATAVFLPGAGRSITMGFTWAR